LQRRFNFDRVIEVVDRGMVSKKLLQEIEEAGLYYIILGQRWIVSIGVNMSLTEAKIHHQYEQYLSLLTADPDLALVP